MRAQRQLVGGKDGPLTSPRRILVLGGARSGKSAFAERLAAECGEPVLYVATAVAGDAEMVERIALHRAQRPPSWRTLEEPLNVADRVATAVSSPMPDKVATVLVEDLTLWLANLMQVDEHLAETRAIEEVHALVALPANVILVSNEVGMGIVPAYPIGRRFRDALGRLNQEAAQACADVHFLVAGLPLRLR